MTIQISLGTTSVDITSLVALIEEYSNELEQEETRSSSSFHDLYAGISEEIESTPLSIISHGSNRIALTTPDSARVVKLAVPTPFRKGTDQNAIEAFLSDELNSTPYSTRFFTVHDHAKDYRWLTMERAAFTDESRKFDEEAASLAILDVFPYLDPDNEFTQAENLGWSSTTNQYAILDYGSFIPHQFIENELDHLPPAVRTALKENTPPVSIE